MSNLVIGLIIVFTVVALIMFIIKIPKILQMNGFHPEYDNRRYNGSNINALIITTSTDKMGDSSKKTGVYASEMTIPYYEFIDANVKVDIASIKGGLIPIEPMSLRYPLRTNYDKRYLKDKEFQHKVQYSISIDNININTYDMVYIAGGWGASYDLGNSVQLGEIITKANLDGKVIGTVCHGGLGLIQAKNELGEPLVKNRNVTAVTNKQISELNITNTPMHPETELKKLGANFESKSSKRDMFSTHVVVDKNLVTGQNQNSSAKVANEMLRVYLKK